MKVWKVFQVKADELCSATPFGKRVLYRKDEWTHAPVGGLLCFKNEEDASQFLWEFRQMNSWFQLWECEVYAHDEVALPYRRAAFSNTPMELLEWLWSHKEAPQLDEVLPDGSTANSVWHWTDSFFPSGTVAFKRLIPRVKIEDGGRFGEEIDSVDGHCVAD